MQILIIEDEPSAVRNLKRSLRELLPNFRVMAEIDSVAESQSWLQANPSPDLIFLDIHLADGLSLELFKSVQIDCPIIFTTAYDQYAIEAFRFNAIDYLLKPVKMAHLGEALQRVKDRRKEQKIDYTELAKAMNQRPSSRMMVRNGTQISLVYYVDIAYCYSQEKGTYLVTRSNKKFSIDLSLDKIEQMLPAIEFFRVNRKCIVNIQSIKNMQSYSKSRVKIETDPMSNMEIISSTERSANFKKWLAGELH